MRRRHNDVEVALANFALTLAKALLVFCVALFLLATPVIKKEDGIKPKIEATISIEWAGKFGYDVDMWLRTPDGNVVWYANKENGAVFLERDDLGGDCDKKFKNTGSLPPADGITCEEIIALRAMTPGEYIFNIHLYSAKGKTGTVDGVQIKAKIQRLNPSVQVIWRGEKIANTVGQEIHMVRFTITPQGAIENFTELRPILLRMGDKNRVSPQGNP